MTSLYLTFIAIFFFLVSITTCFTTRRGDLALLFVGIGWIFYLVSKMI